MNNSKTWIEKLGIPQFNEIVDGNEIVREIDLHKFRAIYTFNTYSEAKAAFECWMKEYENIGENK